MLGMSSAAQDKPVDAAPAEEKKSSTSIVATVLGTAKNLVAKVSTITKAKKKLSSEKKASAPLIEKVTPVAKTSDSADVDDWLNSILEKSSKKAPVAKVESAATEKPAVKKVVKKAAAKKAQAKKSPTNSKTVKKSTARRAR
jgi:gamma-glutamyl:cysteine ligase YbdK (ATP-grasp superfamily)